MTDDIPPTDADKAREVMVDELKTINKYEEMARQAKNPKVAEVINEIAGDEKVHVGNAAALVAMEDPDSVEKMEEGLEETEKDTGVKVTKSGGIDALIQHGIEYRVKKSEGDFAFKKSWMDAFVPEGYHLAADGSLEKNQVILEEESDEERRDRLIDDVRVIRKRISELKEKINARYTHKATEPNEEIVEDLFNPNINPMLIEPLFASRSPADVKAVINLFRRDERFNTMDKALRAVILKTMGRVIADNSKDIKKLKKLKATSRAKLDEITNITDRINGRVGVNKLTAEYMAADDEAQKALSDIANLDRMQLAALLVEVYPNGNRNKPIYTAKGATPSGITANEAVEMLIRDPGAYQWRLDSNSPIYDTVANAIRTYKTAMKRTREIANQINDERILRKRRRELESITEEEITKYLNGIDRLSDIATNDMDGMKVYYPDEYQIVKPVYDKALGEFSDDELMRMDDELREDIWKEAVQSALIEPFIRENAKAARYLLQKKEQGFADLNKELKKRLVDKGEYGESNWANWATEGVKYYGENGYIDNPYEYDASEQDLLSIIKDIRRHNSNLNIDEPYKLASQRWMQGIHNALWDRDDRYYPKIKTRQDLEDTIKKEFPRDTFLTNNSEDVDSFRALELLGINTMGDLRKFVSAWSRYIVPRMNGPYEEYNHHIPKDLYNNIVAETRKNVIDAWLKDRGINLTDEELAEFDKNFVGWGGAYPKSNIDELSSKIRDTKLYPDDMPLKNPLRPHPPLERENRGEYEDWLRYNYVKTSKYAYDTVFTPVYDAIKLALNAAMHPEMFTEEQIKKVVDDAEAMVTKYVNQTADSGIKSRIRSVLVDDTIGAQLADYLVNTAWDHIKGAKTPQEQRVWDLLGTFGHEAKKKLIRKAFSAGFDAQGPYQKDKAIETAQKYADVVKRLQDNNADYPKVIRDALNAMETDFGLITGEIVPPGKDMRPVYAARDNLLGNRFQRYGIDLINGLLKYTHDVDVLDETTGEPIKDEAGNNVKKTVFDVAGYTMDGIDPVIIKKLINHYIANKEALNEYAQMLHPLDEESAMALFNADPRKDPQTIKDIVGSTIGYVMADSPGFVKRALKRQGDMSPEINHINHAAELYQIARKNRTDNGANASTSRIIPVGAGGTGKNNIESERMYDAAEGIKRKVLPGYIPREKTEYQDKDPNDPNRLTSKDENMQRRIAAIEAAYNALSADDALNGIMIRIQQGDYMDDAHVITPDDIGFPEDDLKAKMQKDPEGTIKKIVDKMHRKGAIVGLDFKTADDLYEVLPEMILASGDTGTPGAYIPFDVDSHIPYSEDSYVTKLNDFKTQRTPKDLTPEETQKKHERVLKDRELDQKIEEREKYTSAVKNLNFAQQLQEEARDRVKDAVGYRELRRRKLYEGEPLPPYMEDAEKAQWMGASDVRTPVENIAAAKNLVERGKDIQDYILNSDIEFKTPNPKYSKEFHDRYSERAGPAGLVTTEKTAKPAYTEYTDFRSERNRRRRIENVRKTVKDKMGEREGKIQERKEQIEQLSLMKDMVQNAKQDAKDRAAVALEKVHAAELPIKNEETGRQYVDSEKLDWLENVAGRTLKEIDAWEKGEKELDGNLETATDSLDRWENLPAKAKEAVDEIVDAKESHDPKTHPKRYMVPADADTIAVETKYMPASELNHQFASNNTDIVRSASGQKTNKRPPLRVTHVFSQAIPFYGIKLDLNANEPFDAAKYKNVKKEVQGSKRTNIDRMIATRQKH